jgi:hypothetical protein
VFELETDQLLQYSFLRHAPSTFKTLHLIQQYHLYTLIFFRK